MEDSDKKMLISFLAPYFVGLLILSVFVTMLVFKYVPAFKKTTGPSVVTFDVIKYVNAQRVIASGLLTKSGDETTETNELMYKLSERTKVAIAKIAGDGTLVLVAQTVVDGTTRDITDDVLKELGFPTAVPTQNAVKATLSPTPTQSLITEGPAILSGIAKNQEKAEAADTPASGNLPKLP